MLQVIEIHSRLQRYCRKKAHLPDNVTDKGQSQAGTPSLSTTQLPTAATVSSRGSVPTMEPNPNQTLIQKDATSRSTAARGTALKCTATHPFTKREILDRCGNDPSAGSPTETLLRLHLPLIDKVQTSSREKLPIKETPHNPEASPDRSIGRCDGRCVQRAGT